MERTETRLGNACGEESARVPRPEGCLGGMAHSEVWQVEQRLGSNHLPVQSLRREIGRESKSGWDPAPSPECPSAADGKDVSEAVRGGRMRAWSSRSLLESCRQ